jgi:hypothetical protein
MPIVGCSMNTFSVRNSDETRWAEPYLELENKYREYIGTNKFVAERFANMCDAIEILPWEVIKDNVDQYHYTVYFSFEDEFEPCIKKYLNDGREKVRYVMAELLEDMTPPSTVLGYPGK